MIDSIGGYRSATRPKPTFGPGGPRPDDVKQAPWRHDCHLLASVQAIAARDPRRLAAQFTPQRDGCAFRCYLPDRESRPYAAYIPRVQACNHAVSRQPLWPAYVALAFAQTHGGVASLYHRGEAKASMRWVLGCPAYTFSLGGAAQATREQWDYLMNLHERGEALVLHTGSHAWSVVGAKTAGAARELVLMNPVDAWLTARHAPLTDHRDLGKRWHAVTHTWGARLGQA